MSVPTTTIANGASESAAISLSGSYGAALVGIVFGDLNAADQTAFDAAAWTAADIVFLASADGAIWVPVVDAVGARVRISGIVSDTWVNLNPVPLLGMRRLKLVSVAVGTVTAANQAAARTLSLIVRSV